MAHAWDPPPKGDFAAYVERLAAQAARRSLAQQANPSFDAAPGDADFAAQQTFSDQEAAGRARELFLSPGQQPPSENSLTKGLRQLAKKLETNLQDIAQQQQQKKK